MHLPVEKNAYHIHGKKQLLNDMLLDIYNIHAVNPN